MKHLLRHLPGQTHGPVVTTAVTVSGGPTLLPPVALPDRKDFILYNEGSDIIFIGGELVTVSDGIMVHPAGSFSIQAGRSKIYAVVSGTNQTVRVLESS